MKLLNKQRTAFATLFLLIAMAIPGEVWAQLTDQSGAENGLRGAPRAYKYDARTSALGDATVADPTLLSGYNMNPATLSFVQNPNVVQINSHHSWNNNLMQQTISLPAVQFDNHHLAAQVGVTHQGANALNYLGDNNLPEPVMDGAHLDIAYAFSYENVLSLGMVNSFSLIQNNRTDSWSYFTTIGLLYAPSQSVSYGIAFRGLGTGPVYEIAGADAGNEEPEGEGETLLDFQDLRERLELGATLRFPVNTDNTYLALSLANEKRFGQDGIWYKAGLELEVIPSVALRSGILFQPERDLYTPRFGIGIDAKFVKIDYSISYKDQLFEHFHQLGLTIHFDRL